MSPVPTVCEKRTRREWRLEADCPKYSSLETRYVLRSDGLFALQLVLSRANLSREKIADERARNQLPLIMDPPTSDGNSRLVVLKTVILSGKFGNNNNQFDLGRSTIDLSDVPSEAKRWFSRKHCSIRWNYHGSNGRSLLPEVSFTVEDAASVNGTFLNGLLIPRNSTAYLKSEDVIGVSMTADSHLILGFRLVVPYLSARTVGAFEIETPLPPAVRYSAQSTQEEDQNCPCLDCSKSTDDGGAVTDRPNPRRYSNDNNNCLRRASTNNNWLPKPKPWKFFDRKQTFLQGFLTREFSSEPSTLFR